MNQLLQKLEKIQTECSPDKKKAQRQEEEKDLDDFMRLRKKIAEDIRNTRKQIEERNLLMGNKKEKEGRDQVAISQAVRNSLKQIKADVKRLDDLQKDGQEELDQKKLKKKNVTKEQEEELKLRADIVETAWNHIKECERLEKSGYGNNQITFKGSFEDGEKPTISELPDIDDPKFQLLRRNDKLLDDKLLVIEEGVKIAGEIATEMSKELDKQNILIEDLEEEVNKANDTLEGLNLRMKKTLEGIRKGDRFIVDLILIIIILAIAAFIYNSLVKK